MDAVNLTILVAGALFFSSIVATLISARLGAPLLLIFLVIGMLAGEDGLLGIKFGNPDVALLIGSIALVIILFDGGMRTHPDRVRVVLAPAAVLATLGVVLTCGILGVAASYLFNLTLLEGLLLGAILSSTDAAAVFSIFQSAGLNIKERVASTLEIESGSNDPMAVMLTFTLVGVLAGHSELNWSLSTVFFQQAIVGAAVGYGAGRFFVLLCRKLPLSAAFFPLLAVSYALLIYGLTNQFGGSGFLAVYLMGFLIGNARLPQIQQILRMHDGLAWLSQIIMFLMLGLLVTPSKLIEYAIPALILALVMIFIARPIAVFLSLVPFHFPKKDQVFISWVGLRGAVPIILALFPWLAGVPNKDLYFNVAFFVVIVSLLIQGWSIAPVARWLKLEVPPEPGPDHSMTLDSVDSNDLLQVLSFKVGKGSPVVDSDWQQLNISPDVSYLGVLRKGEWLNAERSPRFQLNDMLLVLSKAKDVKAVSDKVSTSAEQTTLDKLDFFGDFILNGEITLSELDAFYSIRFAEDQDPTQSLSEYITEKFHRRVVVGDQVQLDQLVLTVRQIDEQDQILQVGIKSA
ncbi:MAG: potassium/proton antiporter [Gammaproteobacteria bacterium]|nr:potassium/proton antiporter [Gammaproteobacteria bacterium]MBU2057808.1 potassium/proton antiporter [Gammaproteobacteria bacterium]MBU2176757.1 potassium/proton antiporter [Gammaproteobacteria bacterium]MBU2247890.1 potassium/proton antiporter [Gammaproteobacteria bacterium]MBU2345267.1 potassium/proton antiporter [Gammaproteobacteria bacterium]